MAVALSRRSPLADLPALPAEAVPLLVLAPGWGGCVGVDLGTGTLRRASWDGPSPPLAPFDVAVAPVLEGADDLPDPACPEAVRLAHAPHVVGRLRGRGAERYLRPLLLRPGRHLLGFPGPSLPYWTLAGDRPSVCLLAPDRAPALVRRGGQVACRFLWRGVEHELGVAGPWPAGLAGDGAGPAWGRLAGGPLADVLGFVPGRLVVVLAPPRDGQCHKVVAGLLPRR